MVALVILLAIGDEDVVFEGRDERCHRLGKVKPFSVKTIGVVTDEPWPWFVSSRIKITVKHRLSNRTMLKVENIASSRGGDDARQVIEADANSNYENMN